MTVEQIFAWGEAHHYPMLVLSREPRLELSSGLASWGQFLREITEDQMHLLIARMEAWDRWEVQV